VVLVVNAPASFTSYSPAGKPHIVCHAEYEQGSEQWLQARCGLLTASEMKLILTPTLKVANNDKTRAHVYELAAQRITQYVEPHYIGDDMLRGHEDEVRARLAYSEKWGAVTECGFITSDKWGFTIGYSPDGLVGDDGLIECKSRRQKFQVQTIIAGVPDEHVLQLQTGLLVTEREWVDYVSYCGGMPMAVIRVEPDPEIQQAIIAAATDFEARLADAVSDYQSMLASDRLRWVPTERVIEQEMYA
jgi:predicted phage-related endonuclease